MSIVFSLYLTRYHSFYLYARPSGFKCRSLRPNLTSVSLVGANAESSHGNVIAFPSLSPLAVPWSSFSHLRKVVAGSRRGFDAAPVLYEELIAPRVEKFMTSFHLALSYRLDGAIIAAIWNAGK